MDIKTIEEPEVYHVAFVHSIRLLRLGPVLLAEACNRQLPIAGNGELAAWVYNDGDPWQVRRLST